MKVGIFKGKWKVSNIKEKDNYYVFGDNDKRTGRGGQAIIRNLDNSIGIRTKKEPSRKKEAYYSDSNLSENKSKIDEDFYNIRKVSMNNKVVFSEFGYGNGLSMLDKKAPETYNYLFNSLLDNFNFHNEKGNFMKIIPSHSVLSNSDFISLSGDNIIQPKTNDYFGKKSLNKGYYTLRQMIINGHKISVTLDREIENGKYIILSIPNSTDFLVVKSVGCYKFSEISNEDWCLFEGFSKGFLDTVDDKSGLYQIHFSYKGTLKLNGDYIVNNELFSKTEDVELGNENLKNNLNEGSPIEKALGNLKNKIINKLRR